MSQNAKLVDPDIFLSLLVVRRMLEVNAVKKVVPNLTDNDIEHFTEYVDMKETNVDDVTILSEADFNIHNLIIQLSGNLVMRLIYNSVKPAYLQYTEFFYSLEGVPQTIINFDRQFVESLKTGDDGYVAYVLEKQFLYGENRIKDEFVETRKVKTGS